jgi:hypothetical protein
MDLYDANHDGKIDAGELKKTPALASALVRIDKDHDGAVTESELAERMSSWVASTTIVTSATAYVTLNSQPLQGATITFEPDPCLGPAFKPADGVTDSGGYASVSAHDEKFPGVYLGVYIVKITGSGKDVLPAKYNEQTELGCEVASDIGGIGTINFALTSR